MIYYKVPELRLRVLLFWDCSHTAVALFTPKHFIDVLLVNHRKWWQFPIAGFQFWF